MFGFRPDGRRIKGMDPIVSVTPYLMPHRNDAMVQLKAEAPYEPMARYIAEQSVNGRKITFMNIIVAAYVRAISQNPQCNRFIMNKQVFARSSTTVSFTVLKDPQNNESDETVVKISFDPTDTIFDVSARMAEAVEANRGEETKNFLDKLAGVALAIPGLATFLVAIVRVLDRYGICPKALIDALPFHTGTWITNNASIGLTSVYHHIYNFGTTSMFLGMGSIVRKTELEGGVPKMKRYLPIGVVVDERITSGAHYARFFADIMAGMKNPSSLETPPEQVHYDLIEYHVPKPGAAR